MADDTIPFEKEAVKEYLDEAIEFWREEEGDNPYATGAIHALQSTRASLFGEINPCPECGRTDPHGHPVEEDH